MPPNFEYRLLVLQAFTACFLCGLIWVVQIAHYPAFRFVDPGRCIQFHKFHTGALTRVVALPMLIELVLALSIVAMSPTLWPLLSLFSVVAIWLLTFFVSIPIHNELSKQWAPERVEALIRTNWLRTLLWSLRCVGLFFAL